MWFIYTVVVYPINEQRALKLEVLRFEMRNEKWKMINGKS